MEDCGVKREEDGVHESERMQKSEDNVTGTSSSFNISAVFKNETEAYQCYCNYAHDNDFSVQKDHHSFYSNTRKIKSKDFVCSKAGFKRMIDLNSRKRFMRPDVRTGCPSMVRFAVDEDGYWHVKRFIESHNHELASPSDRHLLRSCRNVVEEKASVLKSMTDAGIRTVDAYAYLAEEVGGYENVGFSKRDAYNIIQKEKRARIEFGDTNSLIQLFKDRQVEDHMFAWDVQIDEHDRLLNFFWVDGRGRIDYECFGDVLIFDISYRLNKYNFVCAPFVGVNNHWQNILLGVAFLSEETIESFTWLFKTFARIMGNNHPKTIFTDQDQAMSRAIEDVLPHTRHRLCQWHIFKKIPSKVPIFRSNNKARGLFYKCMRMCDSEEVFEESWAYMMREGNLHNHEWLQDLYNIRRKWSTAFNKDCFSMGILSTQRSEPDAYQLPNQMLSTID